MNLQVRLRFILGVGSRLQGGGLGSKGVIFLKPRRAKLYLLGFRV